MASASLFPFPGSAASGARRKSALPAPTAVSHARIRRRFSSFINPSAACSAWPAGTASLAQVRFATQDERDQQRPRWERGNESPLHQGKTEEV